MKLRAYNSDESVRVQKVKVFKTGSVYRFVMFCKSARDAYKAFRIFRDCGERHVTAILEGIGSKHFLQEIVTQNMAQDRVSGGYMVTGIAASTLVFYEDKHLSEKPKKNTEFTLACCSQSLYTKRSGKEYTLGEQAIERALSHAHDVQVNTITNVKKGCYDKDSILLALSELPRDLLKSKIVAIRKVQKVLTI